MKALIVNGSPRKNGATAWALKLAVGKIGDGFECRQVHAYDLSVAPCLGCMACRPDKTCVLPPDDGHGFGELLKEADLLVIGTPSYWGNLPAPLKVLFDRNVSTLVRTGGEVPLPNMSGKKAILLLTCGSSDARGALATEMPLLAANLKNILQSGGYEIVDTVEVFSSWDREKNERLLPERIRELVMS